MSADQWKVELKIATTTNNKCNTNQLLIVRHLQNQSVTDKHYNPLAHVRWGLTATQHQVNAADHMLTIWLVYYNTETKCNVDYIGRSI